MVKSLFELSRENGIPFGNDDAETLAAPESPFLVFDILGSIMAFLPLSSYLGYARVSAMFARVCYDRAAWQEAVDELLQQATPERRKQIQSLQLPAHKVYLTLRSGGDVNAKLDALQFRKTNTVTLYSSGLRGKLR